MSSFVIEKKEYVKAAGLVAGIAESKEIWFYSYKVQRNRKAEDYYKAAHKPEYDKAFTDWYDFEKKAETA